MTPVFREATAADDQIVGELLVRAFVEAYAARMPEVVVGDTRKEELRRVSERRAKSRVRVMEVEGRIIGTFTLMALNDPTSRAWLPQSTELKQLALDRAYHGKGLSTYLLADALSEAEKMDARNICLHVRRGAVGVAKMYVAAGYRRDSKADLHLPQIDLEAYFLPIGVESS